MAVILNGIKIYEVYEDSHGVVSRWTSKGLAKKEVMRILENGYCCDCEYCFEDHENFEECNNCNNVYYYPCEVNVPWRKSQF